MSTASIAERKALCLMQQQNADILFAARNKSSDTQLNTILFVLDYHCFIMMRKKAIAESLYIAKNSQINHQRNRLA